MLPYRIRRLLKNSVAFVHPFPPLAAVLFVWLLGWFGQPREVYFAAVEGPFDAGKVFHLVFAALALALLSASLYYAIHLFAEERIDRNYAGSQLEYHRMWKLCRCVGWGTAYFPWLGLACSVGIAGLKAGEHGAEIKQAVGSSLGAVQKLEPGLELLDKLPARLYLAAAATALCGLLVVYLIDRFRRELPNPGRFVGIGALVAVFLVPAVFSDIGSLLRDAVGVLFGGEANLWRIPVVAFYRTLGPVAMAALVTTGLVALLGVFSLLSAQIRFPLIRLCVALIAVAVLFFDWPAYNIAVPILLICGIVGTIGLFPINRALAIVYGFLLVLLAAPTLWQVAGRGQSAGAEIKLDSRQVLSAYPALEESFKTWLGEREADRRTFKAHDKSYPVLIVSVQGGGIFAASAAATLLSRLQDKCDGFARHVFAISGVSGGAVGAAVFHSMMDANDGKAAGCRTERPGQDRSAAKDGLTARTAAVILDDHLSPLLGVLPADLLGLQQDRAAALESSLIRSVNDHGKVRSLREPFSRHWTSAPGAPALLLNATWVETGFRVAFAPFALGGMRDGTLYAFGDRELAGPGLAGISVARAAVVSARFPGVVPAFSVRKTTQGSDGATVQRWNFVDGGYADASGSMTALEVYKALESFEAAKDVDLRLVVLTEARPKTKFATLTGTISPDLVAPANTLLSVGDLVSRQAVMRTLAETDGNNIKELRRRSSRAQNGYDDKWKAALIEIDRQSFSLALGWNISQSTHAIVSLMVGWPELCPALAAASRNESEDESSGSKISAQTIRANSCVLQALTKLVTPPS